MSKAMTLKELSELLDHIRTDHSFGQAVPDRVGKSVKYVDPKIDTRDWMCYAISFRQGGESMTFYQNECHDLPQTLYERCMAWLDVPLYK